MKQFTLPVYVTLKWQEAPIGNTTEILGVSLDEQVAIQRLTTFMVDQHQAINFTELDQEELDAWADSPRREERLLGTWRVSTNKRLWIGCGERVEIQGRDALEPLEGEL